MPTLRTLAALSLFLLFAGCGAQEVVSAALPKAIPQVNASKRKTLGVNSYLWHASLDTLSFLPLASADPFGGVIMTEWSAAPSRPTERVLVTVYIKDRALRADAIKVTVFRQVRKGAEWTYPESEPNTARKIEGLILARARELRLAAIGS